MANELTVQDITNMSVAFAKSGLFGYKSSAEAFSLMMVAQANGIHPAKAVERYHIIQGRPAMKSEAMLAAFQEAGGSIRWITRTDKVCKLHLEHPQGGNLDVEWTIERATKAGLTGKTTWKQYPAAMLSARCVSEGVRALYPACLCGMYTPEEVSDFATAEKGEQRAYKPEFVQAEVLDEPTDKTPAEATESAEAVQDSRDANWIAMCEELRNKAPEAFDAYIKNHNVPDLAEIHDRKQRRELFAALTETVNAATQEAE
jgi:hypothetical protein